MNRFYLKFDEIFVCMFSSELVNIYERVYYWTHLLTLIISIKCIRRTRCDSSYLSRIVYVKHWTKTFNFRCSENVHYYVLVLFLNTMVWVLQHALVCSILLLYVVNILLQYSTIAPPAISSKSLLFLDAQVQIILYVLRHSNS